MVSDILLRYFRTWETHDLVELRRLFREHARYEILGSKVLHGIKEIENYWIRNAEVQRAVTCSVSRFAETNTSIFAQWRAKFFRIDRDEEYDLDGLIWLLVENEEIVELVECYRHHVNLE